MTQNEKDWYLADRARALARMHLTRRDDLVITEAGKDVGLDYLVRITKEPGRPSVREFGVLLHASLLPTTEDDLSKALPSIRQDLNHRGEYPYPVCLFLFTMEDNQGYFAWLVEPVVSEEGRPQLRALPEPNCKKLDRQALDTIVARVDEWYEAFYASITASERAPANRR